MDRKNSFHCLKPLSVLTLMKTCFSCKLKETNLKFKHKINPFSKNVELNAGIIAKKFETDFCYFELGFTHLLPRTRFLILTMKEKRSKSFNVVLFFNLFKSTDSRLFFLKVREARLGRVLSSWLNSGVFLL